MPRQYSGVSEGLHDIWPSFCTVQTLWYTLTNRYPERIATVPPPKSLLWVNSMRPYFHNFCINQSIVCFYPPTLEAVNVLESVLKATYDRMYSSSVQRNFCAWGRVVSGIIFATSHPHTNNAGLRNPSHLCTNQPPPPTRLLLTPIIISSLQANLFRLRPCPPRRSVVFSFPPLLEEAHSRLFEEVPNKGILFGCRVSTPLAAWICLL